MASSIQVLNGDEEFWKDQFEIKEGVVSPPKKKTIKVDTHADSVWHKPVYPIDVEPQDYAIRSPSPEEIDKKSSCACCEMGETKKTYCCTGFCVTTCLLSIALLSVGLLVSMSYAL